MGRLLALSSQVVAGFCCAGLLMSALSARATEAALGTGVYSSRLSFAYEKQDASGLFAQAGIDASRSSSPTRLRLRSDAGDPVEWSIALERQRFSGEGLGRRRTRLGPFDVFVPVAVGLDIVQTSARAVGLRRYEFADGELRVGGGIHVATWNAGASAAGDLSQQTYWGGFPVAEVSWTTYPRHRLSFVASFGYGGLTVNPTRARWHEAALAASFGLTDRWQLEAGFRRESVTIASRRRLSAATVDLPFQGFAISLITHF